MRRKTASAIVILLVASSVGSYFLLANYSSQKQPSLVLLKSVQIPGVPGRLDHMDVDPLTHRLFLAAVNDGSVVVVDLVKGNVTRIGGFSGAHGVLFVPQHQRLYVTTDNGTVFTLLGSALRPVASIKLSVDADNIRYDQDHDRIFVAFGQGQTAGLAVIDPVSNTLTATVILGAHPEAFQLDVATGGLYANVPTLGEIERVSLTNLSVTARWEVHGYLDNFPMTVDTESQAVVVGTWFPASALSFSEATSKLVSQVSICGDADDLFYVLQTSTILASCGQGSAIVIRVSGDSLSVSSTVPTGEGARTSLFSPALNEFFVAVPASTSQSALLLVFDLSSP